jgi:RNA-directed DNA polymerase
MQALYKLALAPVAEIRADRNSYGFREGRGCHDAVAAAFNALSKPNSATSVLEGDIMGCFDNISYEWMLKNIPIDKVILRKWLEAGYVENGITYPSHKGTPQGGIISPTLANLTLDGMEQAVHNAVRRRSRVNFIRYADDFIVTGKSRRLLQRQVRPAIEAFLAERGLQLSQEKTVISHIKDGFEFLGQHFRKHGRVLHISPAMEGVHALLRKIRTLIRKHVSAPMESLIKKLNHMLRGWALYHRYVVSSEAFKRVDTYVYQLLWRMIRRRHPKKSKGWLVRKYWTASGRKWVFSIRSTYKGKLFLLRVFRVASLGITRYIKIRADANPYLPQFAKYFWQRRHDKMRKRLGALSARQFRAAYS